MKLQMHQLLEMNRILRPETQPMSNCYSLGHGQGRGTGYVERMFGWKKKSKSLFSRVLRDSTPHYVGLLVGRLVDRSLFYFFWRYWAFWAYRSCPDALMTLSSTAPAHPHATRVAVYPALFSHVLRSILPSVRPSHLIFLAFMFFWGMLLLSKCSTDLKYGPCPPGRDWGSRVSGLLRCDRDQLPETLT